MYQKNYKCPLRTTFTGMYRDLLARHKIKVQNKRNCLEIIFVDLLNDAVFPDHRQPVL